MSPETRRQEVPVTCTGHSDQFGWSGLRLEDYADLPPSDFGAPAMAHHLLVYHYKALDGAFHHSCAGRKTTTHLRDGQLSFIPAGADNHWTFGEGAPSALHILIDAESMDAALGKTNKDLRDVFQVDSDPLRDLAHRLRRELTLGGITGPLFADAMMALLGEALRSTFGEATPSDNMADANVSAARDLIEAEFSRQISLAELAEVCELSQSQILRAFRQKFGTTPHQYLMHRRVKAGQSMLLSDDTLPLAQLALDLGYADQSHFTRSFSAITGVTPDKFRARA